MKDEIVSNRNARVSQNANRFYGAVIPVVDLQRCRSFYSEVLQLGKPVVDSSFWVEFEPAAGGMVVALEHVQSYAKAGDKEQQPGVAVCLQVPDLEAFEAHLHNCGCKVDAKSALVSGKSVLRLSDPEGNPLIAMQG